ncbi:hypothetical protein KZZ52_15380 [Dactylosporangium sp. AC04546]|nr:hypothetical protein [Dactylosporangium sp. AC04546]WVK86688.1 hypothetical protein KZZ52_15380 [Dactylosporangium sp. AC04546]
MNVSSVLVRDAEPHVVAEPTLNLWYGSPLRRWPEPVVSRR